MRWLLVATSFAPVSSLPDRPMDTRWSIRSSIANCPGWAEKKAQPEDKLGVPITKVSMIELMIKGT